MRCRKTRHIVTWLAPIVVSVGLAFQVNCNLVGLTSPNTPLCPGVNPAPSASLNGGLFWASDSCKAVFWSDMDGMGNGILASTYSPGPVNSINGVAIDSVSRKLYWGNSGIRRSNLDGSNVETVVPNLLDVFGVALDGAAGKVYWTQRNTATISRSNLDGTSIEEIVATEHHLLLGISVDPNAEHVYWIDAGDPSTSGNGRIRRSGLDGTNIVDIVTGLDVPLYLALDSAAGVMYWTERGASYGVRRSNLDGTAVEDLVAGSIAPAGIALDITNGKMYWLDDGLGSILRANLDGSNVEEINVGGVFIGSGLAVLIP